MYVLYTRDNMHLFFSHIQLLNLGLMAWRQLRLCFLWLTVTETSVVDDSTTKDIIF